MKLKYKRTFFSEDKEKSTTPHISPARSCSMVTKSSTGSTAAFFPACAADLFIVEVSRPSLRFMIPAVDEVSCCHNSRIGPNFKKIFSYTC